MMRFVAKPIIVEAAQWFPGVVVEGIREFKQQPNPGVDPVLGYTALPDRGDDWVYPGEWLVKDGDTYCVMKDEQFQRLFVLETEVRWRDTGEVEMLPTAESVMRSAQP